MEQERLIAIWKETISGLMEEGQPTKLAEKMLRLMERRLDAPRAGLAKLANRPRWRARAFSERANSGVGHCGRTRGRNHPPYPDLGFGG